jgi:hypothetical protein
MDIRMNEKKLKHLDFIQNIITRMNANSFVIKGWSVTLVSALFALAADKANTKFAYIAFLPVIMFWVLDGFFLSQERQYRGLYKEVVGKDEKDIDFNLDASKYDSDARGWVCCITSATLLIFHGVLLLAVFIVVFAIR